jgi:hypothetical protein
MALLPYSIVFFTLSILAFAALLLDSYGGINFCINEFLSIGCNDFLEMNGLLSRQVIYS